MRTPRPAASTMARRGGADRRSGFVMSPLLRLRRPDMGVVPRLERRQRRMRQRPAQVAPYARQVTQILRLAVAPVEPRENAENLGRALRAEHRIERDESGKIEVRVVGLPGLGVTAEQRDLHRL